MNKVGGPIGPPTHLGGIDLVTNINYNGGKEVDYAYNAVGDLVRMEDWTGVNTFEYDLLSQLKSVTDHKGNVVSYTYDDNGNKTSLTYPDDTTVTYTYDGVGNLTSVTESDGRTTTYTYDGMGRLVKMEYPHGWVEEYEYDAVGQLLRVTDTDPSGKDMKQQKHVYEYDACGNLVYEYMRGNGTGEATVENTYTYDALHRITGAVENYGNQSRSYVYDSLGNLTYESNSNNEVRDYKLNDLNQVTEKTDAKGKESTYYTYDGRGNLILEEYGKNNKRDTVAEYTYDETNRMVLGENSSAETSAYEINGLGALVEQTWVIAKNGYGYHDVDAAVEEPAPEVPEIPEQPETGEEVTEPEAPETGEEATEPEAPETGEEVTEPEQPEVTDPETTEPEIPETGGATTEPETPEVTEPEAAAPETETTLPAEAEAAAPDTTAAEMAASVELAGDAQEATLADTPVSVMPMAAGGNSDKKDPDKPTGSDVNKTSTVVKQFVVDYTTETFEPLMEHEVNGLDYKYVYGNDRLSVDIWSVNNSGSIVENGDHIRLYYHMDYLGTADYLTSPVSLRVEAWTHYNEWGEITHNAVLNCGQRELDLVKRYATHDYDAVLDLYYAKARMYDAERRQFNSVDPILDPSVYDLKTYTDDPMQFVQYLYVQNQPLVYIDPLGLVPYETLRNIFNDYMNTKKKLTNEPLTNMVRRFVNEGSTKNPSLLFHQIAQVLTAVQLSLGDGQDIELEYGFTDGTRADIVYRSKSDKKYYALEIKPESYIGTTRTGALLRTYSRAAGQQRSYMAKLSCEKGVENVGTTIKKSPLYPQSYTWTLVNTGLVNIQMKITYHNHGIVGYQVIYNEAIGQKRQVYAFNSKVAKELSAYNNYETTDKTAPAYIIDPERLPSNAYMRTDSKGKQVSALADVMAIANGTFGLQESAKYELLKTAGITATGIAAVAATVTVGTVIGATAGATFPAFINGVSVQVKCIANAPNCVALQNTLAQGLKSGAKAILRVMTDYGVEYCYAIP